MKEFLECGKIVTTHGIKGEVKIQPWCDSAEYLLDFSVLYLTAGKTPMKIESSRVHKNMFIAKFVGINTPEDGVKLRGKILYMKRSDAPDDGFFFVQDLLGLRVIDADSEEIYGKLTDVFSTGAHDVYELVTDSGVKHLFPAIHQVIIETDITERLMRIRPLKGLFDEN